MAPYKHLNGLIRDGMELKLECRHCRRIWREDPADVKDYIAGIRKWGKFLGDTAEPDLFIDRCLAGIKCGCGASDFKVDAIKPLNGHHTNDA